MDVRLVSVVALLLFAHFALLLLMPEIPSGLTISIVFGIPAIVLLEVLLFRWWRGGATKQSQRAILALSICSFAVSLAVFLLGTDQRVLGALLLAAALIGFTCWSFVRDVRDRRPPKE